MEFIEKLILLDGSTFTTGKEFRVEEVDKGYLISDSGHAQSLIYHAAIKQVIYIND